jgi:hypothetical protein
VWSLDLHLGYPIPLGRGLQLSLSTDLFNITNQQVATGVDEVWSWALNEPLDPDECGGPGTGPGTSCPLGSPLWGTPTAYQPPRVVRLGLKLSW